MLKEKIQQKQRLFSVEVFPPKATTPMETIYETLEELGALAPDFVSVTFGAGGSDNTEKTLSLTEDVQNRFQMEGVMHLACVRLDRPQAEHILHEIKQRGIRNVLALRGDSSPDFPAKNEFPYASDLVKFLKEKAPDLHIMGACYPEGHLESDTPEEDIFHLKEKVDAGADHLVSQLFFDNDMFYRFWERAQKMGIQVPIEAGIMPVTGRAQIGRMSILCGASLPRPLLQLLHKFGDHPEDMRKAGVEYACRQISDLWARGVDGIHLYTMNNGAVAKEMASAFDYKNRA